MPNLTKFGLRRILLCRFVFVNCVYGAVGWPLSPCDNPLHRILCMKESLHLHLIHFGIKVLQDVLSLSFLKL